MKPDPSAINSKEGSTVADFADSLNRTNLVRMWWLILSSTTLSISVAIFNTVSVGLDSLVPWQAFDVGGSLLFLFLVWIGRQKSLSEKTISRLTSSYFAFWLILMTGYYFSVMGPVGETATYAIGVVAPAVLLLVPPRVFLPLLLTNHLLFCTLLFSLPVSALRPPDALTGSLVNGSLGVLIAGLAAWFLYSGRKSQFQSQQLLTRRTEEAAVSASHLRTILENIPFQAWLVDPQGFLLAANSAMRTAIGRTPSSLTGHLLVESVSPEACPIYIAGNEEILRTGEKKVFVEKVRMGLQERWIEVFKSPVMGEEGKVLALAGLARDVTETKQMEEDLREADRVKGEFLAMMSHEIRTPIHSILGYANLLQSSLSCPLQKEQADSILQGGKMLLSLINDILDFSKLESGPFSLSKEPFDLEKLVERVFRLMRPMAEEKNIGLQTVWEGEYKGLHLHGDPVRLEQILVNLLSNGIKFTERGSVILSISLRQPPPPSQATEVTFRITDTGIGISPEMLHNLFQPFQQGDRRLSRRFGGTGLGLVIANRLCNLMGGRISVESEVDKGSTFIAALRFQKLSSEPLSPEGCYTKSSPRDDFSSLRVLVVEDNPSNLRLMGLLLRRWGLDADLCESGEAAMERIQETRYDLVLMDVQMPGMDGLETTGVIRKREAENPERGQVLIVALTAMAMPGDRVRCLEAGMNDYLPKPAPTEDLRRVLRHALQLRCQSAKA